MFKRGIPPAAPSRRADDNVRKTIHQIVRRANFGPPIKKLIGTPPDPFRDAPLDSADIGRADPPSCSVAAQLAGERLAIRNALR